MRSASCPAHSRDLGSRRLVGGHRAGVADIRPAVHHSNHFVRPSAIARTIAHAAATNPRTIKASGLLNRNISAQRVLMPPGESDAVVVIDRACAAYSGQD